MAPCKQALEDADLSPSEIDDVILVGGQTRMPLVQSKVAEFFGKEPRKDVNPDEAVAVGATARRGVVRRRQRRIATRRDSAEPGIETVGGVMTALIEKNTTIPTKKDADLLDR